MRRLKYLIPLTCFLALSLFFLFGLDKNPNLLPSALLNKPMPVFSAPLLDKPGQLLNTSELKGEVILLNVWSSWCAPCRQEHNALMNIAKEQEIIYGLNYKDNQEKAKEWLKLLGNPYRSTLIDKDGDIAIDLGVYGVPETFIIDKKGVVRHRYIGLLTDKIWQDELKPKVESLKEEQ